MTKGITRRKAISLGLGAAAASVVRPAFGGTSTVAPAAESGPDSARSDLPTWLLDSLLPSPKQVSPGSGKPVSASRLKGCLVPWEDFAPDEWIRTSVGDLEHESQEAYRLEVDEQGASIVGASEAGVFYGVQTLKQIVTAGLDAEADLPAASVLDWPDIAYRAVHFDTKHHLDSIDAYYRAIDRLSSLKANAIIWEFEDKLGYRRRPIVGAANAIPIEEIQALTRYANRRHVEISPLVQGLGHASFILKHEAYAHLRDDPGSDWAFDPLADETYAVQFDLYRDAMDATPGSRYMHIGGDEVSVGKSQAAIDSGMDPLSLHLHWLNRVTDFLVEHGRTPIMWDDMPLKHGEVYRSTHDVELGPAENAQLWQASDPVLRGVVDQFPREVVYMRWSYHTPRLEGNLRTLDWYADHGLQAMTATAAQTRWPVYPRRNGNAEPIRDLSGITADRDVPGILCTSWDDDSPHMAFFWRGWAVFSEFAWHSDRRTAEEALLAYAAASFGQPAARFAAEGLRALERAMDIWDTLLLDGVRRNVCRPSTMDAIINPPGHGEAALWPRRHQERMDRAAEGLRWAEQARAALKSALQLSRRNRYELRLALALVELQSWSHEAIDNPGVAPEPGLDERWKSFLDVFSEQRIPRKPDGYILDQNHHVHQANSSLGPEWMIAVELEFDRRLRER